MRRAVALGRAVALDSYERYLQESSQFTALRLLGRNAIQVLLAAKEKLIPHDSRRGIDTFVDGVGSENLKSIALSENDRGTFATGQINASRGTNRR